MWSKFLDYTLRSFVRQGTLDVGLPDGTKLTFGTGEAPRCHVLVRDFSTLRRIVLNPELAVGEAYMRGGLSIENDDVRGFLKVVLLNLDQAERAWWQRWHLRMRTRLRHFMLKNAPALSKKNAAHHYDLSGDLYNLFLDEDRQYSCAYFRTPADTLEQAQVQKKNHIAHKLRIERGMHVLDIGCGWGGMALTLARDYGARVTGITLSEEQLAVAKTRAVNECLQHQVDFQLIDYRELGGSFDRIVSVGMFEHVGLPHFDTYFETINKRLTPDGIALVHTIGANTPAGGTNAWIAKYIFPGGYIPNLAEVAGAIERQDLRVTDVELLWTHYAETLRHWQQRFEANVDKVASLYDETFVRMWRFYLAACEMTFRHRAQTVFQFQLTKSANVVPMTRDYLYAHDRTVRQAAE